MPVVLTGWEPQDGLSPYSACLHTVKTMKTNVGGYDRLARLVAGPVLLVVGLASLGGLLTLAAGTAGVALGGLLALAGMILTVTALTRTCPLNSLLGLDTSGDAAARSGEEVETDTRTS